MFYLAQSLGLVAAGRIWPFDVPILGLLSAVLDGRTLPDGLAGVTAIAAAYWAHSPVVLIEFDHQRPAGLRHLMPPNVPNKEHIHVVVRTPNGNDYGKDLLRQHLLAEKH